jgi:hypothetical protein
LAQWQALAPALDGDVWRLMALARAVAELLQPMRPRAAYRDHLRQGLLDHVRRSLEGHVGPIGCEHSSGLDSNAVLGALVLGAALPPERLHTWSHEGGGEGRPLEQFRPFFALVPSQCHRLVPGEGAGGRGLSFY